MAERLHLLQIIHFKIHRGKLHTHIDYDFHIFGIVDSLVFNVSCIMALHKALKRYKERRFQNNKEEKEW